MASRRRLPDPGLRHGRRIHGRSRFGALVLVLVVVTSVAVPASVATLWLRDQVLDTDTYVSTVAPLAANPAIDAAVTDRVVSVLVAGLGSGALAARGEATIRVAVQEVVTTAAFRQIWRTANTQAHEALLAVLDRTPSPFLTADGAVQIDLSAVIAEVRRVLGAGGLALIQRESPALLRPHLVIASRSSIDRVRTAVRLLRRAAVVLPVVAAACLLLALLLTDERRRTLRRAGIGIAACSGLSILGVVLLRSVFLNDVVGPDVPRAAARAIYEVVVRELRSNLETAAIGGVVLAALGLLAGLAGRRQQHVVY